MKMHEFAKTNSPLAATLRRAALAGLLMLTALAPLAGAQTPNDIPVPTPYDWPTFHAGGLAGPNPFAYTTPGGGTTSLNQAFPDSPIYTQLMGTPSGFALLDATGHLQTGSKITEVPSFLLGNYVPSQPPTASAADIALNELTFFPSHFRDDLFALNTWSAPFTYLGAPTITTNTGITVDDDNTFNTTAGDTATLSTGWTQTTGDTTATNSEYFATNAVAADSGATATAVYTFTVPATPGAGLYTVTLHLPDPAAGQYRIPDAHYVIKRVSGATTTTLFDDRISQTETNDPQYLAGPFALAVGDTLTVTLDNTTNSSLSNSPIVLADSVALVPGAIAGGGAAVNGSPTAINSTQYPEIQDALYYGSIAVPDPVTGLPTRTADNTNPYGNTTIGNNTSNTVAAHKILQLVYFGRYETIVLTDAAGNLVDATGKPSPTPVTQQVGAVYCVDGLHGDVVWRFQTPDILSGPITTPTTAPRSVPSQAVFSTPAIARVNVKVNIGTTAIPNFVTLTKLVCIVADNNGLVYCLDAIGNRNSTSNSTSIGATGTGSNTYNQPIYNPAAGLGQVTTDASSATIAAHVGTTAAYWMYRPSTTKDTTPNAANDLPIPQSFGLASPTVYVDPTQPIDTTTIAPGVTASSAGAPPTLAPNATVYIGNSNGVLYALDGTGTPVTVPTAPATTEPSAAGDLYDTSHYVGILSAGYDLTATPTPAPKWWFSVNGTQIGTAATEDSYSITSAPAILQTAATGTAAAPTVSLAAPYQIFFTTANDTSNEGRVYALASTGPTGVGAVGGTNYNTASRPYWSFPRAYQLSPTLPIRPPLGSIHGSPVVFTNPDDGTTRVYVAADSNEDGVIPADQGRVWSIRTVAENGGTATAGQTDAPGEAAWAYPDTYDPNKYTLGIGENKTPGLVTLDGNSHTAAQDDDLDPVGAFDFATPAVGIVQFPTDITYGTATTRTGYVHTDSMPLNTVPGGIGNRTSHDVRGQSVPMLYVGSYTEAVDGTNFLALDLDGVQDYERNINCFGTQETTTKVNTPLGYIVSAGGFQSSPLLIVNSTSATNLLPGNGGQVFMAGADNNLYEISATPTPDVGDNSTAPQLPVVTLGGFGPYSSPAVSAFSGATLNAANTVNSAVDWVYGGDSKLGIARGVTPKNLGGSGAEGVDYGNTVIPDSQGPGVIPQQFPLHAYIFDGTANHKAGDANMADANPINSSLPVFEWGQPVYIRLSNVVPPNTFAVDNTGNVTSPAASFDRLMYDATLAGLDPTDPGNNIFYTNGGPITVQLTDVDNEGTGSGAGQTDTVTIPATILPDAPTATTTPLGDGFLHRAGPGAQDGDGPAATASGDVLADHALDHAAAGVTSQPWIGATTYLIGNGSNRRNTPGARRRIVSATQVAQAYRRTTTTDPVGGGTTTTYTFVSSVTLNLLVNSSANAFSRNVVYQTGANGKQTGPPTGTLQRIAPVDQPTFGILNPIAVRAAGYPLQLGAAPNYAIPVIGTGHLGPFNGVSNPTTYTDELEAYGNGNRVPRTAPTSGVVAGGRSFARQRTVPIVVSTGDINHGTTGDNADPTNLNAVPAVGNTTTRVTETSGTAQPAFNYGPYTLNVADRSALGLINDPIRNLTIEPGTLDWQDNSDNNGPGAVVNPMPWESMPLAVRGQSNSSQDYPNISASTVAHNLITNQIYGQNGGTTPGTAGNLSNQAGMPDPATAHGATSADRNVYLDPVQVQVKVPRFQPANLQLFDQSIPNGITPDSINRTTSVVFPQGYVSRENVYVDSNHNRRYDRGEAYRQIRVFTGVPADLSTQIQDTTIDLGRLPQSFGTQTENYSTTTSALGIFQPYPLPTPAGVTWVYPQFFKPLTIVNKGNVNLLNVHLDQKTQVFGAAQPASILLQSTALDTQASIPAFDLNNLGGPYGGTLSNTSTSGTVSAAEQPYLLRSTLDPDLVTVYGRNPAITGNATNNAIYPGATIHKALVGDTAPTKMTVPDVPHNNDPTVAGTGFNMTVASVPTIGAAAPPFIGLAVPLGTPVGTYAIGLQAYEGLDPAGYLDVYNKYAGGSAPYAAILPPKYGTSEINAAVPATPTVPASPLTPANLNDALTLLANGTRYVPLQPYSNAAVVKATVTEARITNGAGRGDLPQVDAGPSGKQNTNPIPSSNFLPSAFRDPNTGNISVYWTTSPRSTGVTPPYSLLGANLDFTKGYFGANTANNWWKPINPNVLTTGVNSNINVTSPVAGFSYAFVTNVTGGASSQNQLLCYPVTASSGVLGATGVPVSANTSQSFFGVHGLYAAGFTDAYPGSSTPISNDLWAFWYGGARGRSAIYFASGTSAGVQTGSQTAFGPAAVLPIPAGLVSVSDPNAVLTFASDATGASVPVIEVTYTGIAADGNADIYVSRYRPYLVRQSADATKTVKDANGNDTIGLALQSEPLIAEQLQATDGNLWWQARDVAWTRSDLLNLFINGISVLQNTSGTQNADGSFPLIAGIKTSYDRATNTVVYTNVALPTVSGTTTNGTVYVDLSRGRIRFSPQYTATAGISVVARFVPTARRITTDSRADTAPIAFIDDQFKQNEASVTVNGVSNGIPRALADRYWFLWRKSGTSGTSTTPTLFYKTQRLTLDLNLPTAAGFTQFPGLKLDAAGLPQITVTVAGTQVYPGTSTTTAAVDIDWKRGRVYFPIVFPAGTALAGKPSEGLSASATFILSSGTTPYTSADPIYWLDEPRLNEAQANRFFANGPAAGSPTGFPATSTGEIAVPIDTAVNESNVNAFLDPFGNENTPHKVWLFWNSTRNGTADLYYETISPLFSATAGG